MKAYFDFEEVLRRAVDLIEGLLPGFRDGLHGFCSRIGSRYDRWVGRGVVYVAGARRRR